MHSVLSTIREMSELGFDDSSILATIRSTLEAEERRESEYWDTQEATLAADKYARERDDRRRLRELVAAGADGFALEGV